MKKLLPIAISNLLLQLATFAASFISLSLISKHFKPEMFADLGDIQNTISFLSALSGSTAGLAFVKLGAHSTSSSTTRIRALKIAMPLLFLGTLASLALSMIWLHSTEPAWLNAMPIGATTVAFLLCIPTATGAASAWITSYLMGCGKNFLAISLQITNIAASTIILYISVTRYEWPGLFATIILSNLPLIAATALMPIKNKKTIFHAGFKYLAHALQNISTLAKPLKSSSSFLAIGLVSGLFAATVPLINRNIVALLSTQHDAGLWQVCNRSSDAYLTLALGILTMFFVPKFMREHNLSQASNMAQKSLLIIMPIGIACSAFVYLSFPFWKEFLFPSLEYNSIQKGMSYFFLADAFKILAWTYGMIVVSRPLLFASIVLEVVHGILAVIFTAIFCKLFGWEYTPIGAAINYFLYFIHCKYWLNKHSNLENRPNP